MKNMIETAIASRLFHSDQVERLFDNANHRAIARSARAIAARIYIGEIVATRAVCDAMLYVSKSFEEALDVGIWNAQDVKGEALRGLLPDSGQALELVYQFGYRFGEIEH